MLRLFVNILTPDDKFPLLKRDNLTQEIQMHLSQEQQTFTKLLIPFLKFTLNLNILKKR